jgi:hypothetical protein
MSEVYKYRVFCETTNEYVYGWSENPTEQCPNNNTHTVRSGSLTIIDTVSTEEIKASIVEENVQTNGYYQTSTEVITVTGIGEATETLSWPFGISLIQATLYLVGDEVGDKYEVYLAPNTIVGAVTAPVASGSTVLPVSATVVENMDPGFWADITGGQHLGRVISKDMDAMTITVENPLESDLSGGEYVEMTIKLVNFLELGPFDKINIGGSTTKAKYLPAGTPVVLKYISNSAGEKYAALQIEYYY